MADEDWLDDLIDAIGKAAIVLGAAILGGLLLKALFDKNTNIYRCPKCNLVVMKNARRCRRCGQGLDWTGVL